MINRIDWWLRPKIEPIRDDEIIKKLIRVELYVYIKIIIGIIFCQVDKTRQLIQLILLIILINQKWKGAAPNFNNKDKLINIIRKVNKLKFSVINKEFVLIIKREDLRA